MPGDYFIRFLHSDQDKLARHNICYSIVDGEHTKVRTGAGANTSYIYIYIYT